MSARDPREVLRAHGLWSKKHFGQNFLVAPDAPTRIAAAGGAGPEDVAFEIGPGVGTLTHALAERAGRVVALEYDFELVPVCRKELAYAGNVEVCCGNVLDVDWDAEAAKAGRPLVIYGNVPYHLSTDIVTGLLDAPQAWRRACFLLQREFAIRAAAAPGDKQCSALSAAVALQCHATIAFELGAADFHPAPKVDSAVLVLERRATPAADVADPKAFRTLVRALFAQRRKMARKALKAVHPDPEALLAEAGLEPTRRGETFTLDELAALSRAWRPPA